MYTLGVFPRGWGFPLIWTIRTDFSLSVWKGTEPNNVEGSGTHYLSLRMCLRSALPTAFFSYGVDLHHCYTGPPKMNTPLCPGVSVDFKSRIFILLDLMNHNRGLNIYNH